MHGYKNHADQKMTLAYALLKGKARDISVSTKNGIAAKNAICRTKHEWEFTDQQIIDSIIFDLTKYVFDRENGNWRAAYCRQRAYMRGSLRIGKLDPQKFADWLSKMKQY